SVPTEGLASLAESEDAAVTTRLVKPDRENPGRTKPSELAALTATTESEAKIVEPEPKLLEAEASAAIKLSVATFPKKGKLNEGNVKAGKLKLGAEKVGKLRVGKVNPLPLRLAVAVPSGEP
ncbi:hypothetical protein ABG067_008985, partial [Albugo candida]